MISEHKFFSKTDKIFFETHKLRLKTIVKMEKNKKILSLIQYKQYTSQCYAFIEKNCFIYSRVRISTKLKNKRFKNTNKKFITIKKITPEDLIEFLQYDDLDYLYNDINSFSGSLDIEKSDDVRFYINKCLDFFEEIKASNYFCNISINIAESDFLKHSYNLEQFFYSHFFLNLHSLFIDMFQSYMDNLKYFVQKIYDMSTDSVSKSSAKINLMLPKADLIIKKVKTNKNNYYSKIETQYTIFHINTINELLDTIIYFIIYHNITIKECGHCHKLFIPLRKDAVYCNNPSPEKPDKTCKQLRTHFNSKQKDKFDKIASFYDRIAAKCSNNKKKNSDYIKIWEIYKNKYNELMEDIYHLRFKQSAMIKWQEDVLKNPYILLPKEAKSETDDFDVMELHNRLINEAENMMK